MEEKDEALHNWYESLSMGYQRRCRYSMKKFFNFLSAQGWKKVSGDIILEKHFENRKSDDKKAKFYFDDLLPLFVVWLEKNGISNNSAVTTANSVRGFFKHHREPLQIQNGRIRRIEKRKRWHSFSLYELVKMVQVGDLAEKTVILLSVCLGLRSGDFVKLLRKPIIEAYKDSDGKFPLEFEAETKKEGVISIGHITEECWNSLKLYWKSLPESEFIFPSNINGKGHVSQDFVNDVLKNCWVKAFPEREDVKHRFHELRSYKISVLTNSGVNQWAIKRMTGKKVSKDILVYLTGLDLKEQFIKAEKSFTLMKDFTPNNRQKLETVVEKVDNLRFEVEEWKSIAVKMKSQVKDIGLELKMTKEILGVAFEEIDRFVKAQREGREYYPRIGGLLS